MQAIHHPGASSATALDTPAGSGNTSSSSSSSDASNDTTITANDFLTLLVAEMKNQDPTADTDPNAYIDQLVQVNSLQQLIAINQDLGGSTTSSSSNTDGSGSSDISSHAMSAASRLATSLAPKHEAVPMQQSRTAASKYSEQLPTTEATFREKIHQS